MRRVAVLLACVSVAAGSGLGAAGAATAHVVPAPSRPGIAVGLQFACGLSSAGTVKCWGSNRGGDLGPGKPPFSTVPVAVSGVANATAIAAGTEACALISNGTIKCWGSEAGSAPTAVQGITTAVAISDQLHACAVLKNGTVECWGSGGHGELGNGVLGADSSTPVVVKGLKNAVAVSTGSEWSCAVLKDGTARCWGTGVFGSLGNGHSSSVSLAPTQVKGLTGAVKISSGNGSSCALLANGGVECWGDDIAGQLGNGTKTDGGSSVPVKVKNVSGAVSISVGSGYACATLANGRAKCWGENAFGTLGNGKTLDESRSDFVNGLSTTLNVSAGGDSTCAVLKDGTAQCWGQNAFGQLGRGNRGSGVTNPVVVRGLNLGSHA